MATLLFAAAGSAVGGAIGGSILGVTAATLGQAAGAYLGSVIDQSLMPGPGTTRREGPRLQNLQVMAGEAGTPMSEIHGRTAVSGTVIWATNLLETANTSSQKVGSGKKKGTVKTTEYTYSVSFAISLGEGPLSGFGRIWADGVPLDVSDLESEGRLRFYSGGETQSPDPLIAATEGTAPAFRGCAYLVFEGLELGDFGNRIPQIRVEVFGPSGDMEDLVRGVTMIPGATEWGYDPDIARSASRDGLGQVIETQRLNANRYKGRADLRESLDLLDVVLPSADTVSLVVAWFGTDLRAGLCEIEPRVEYSDRETLPRWAAGGLTYGPTNIPNDFEHLPQVGEVSRISGQPAYGSTPADSSVIRCIRHLRARGKRVVLYPFVMMDVTDAQALPDPAGTGVQGAYPWRGRIEPRAGHSVSAEVSAFLGTASASDFSAVNGEDHVDYTGPAAFGFRRFILHLAALAKAAGGVDAFLVGSEMRGLSMAHAGGGSFPFVDGLRSLAGEVRTLLPSAEISYAADWSEYHSYRSGSDVYFHLDPLWADPEIDFVGIDNYLPLSDWRAGTDHLDYDPQGVTSVYDLDYLKSNIEGGEYWDWFYATEADRTAQIRTAISDAAHGEDWVFRQKAWRDWQGQAHHDRPGGTRSGTSTAWTPGSKPIWFTELGCSAVTFGTNQPNVFASVNSSEGALPWFSDGARDDFIQRQYLRAWLEWLGDNATPCDPADVQVWTWDARPWPEFPQASGLWADGPDWTLGHWLTGRAGAAPLAELATRRAIRHGLTAADLDTTRAWGQADGVAYSGLTTWRDVLQPFEIALAASLVEDGGQIVIESRAAPFRTAALVEADLVEDENGETWRLLRSALEDRPQAASLLFRDGLGDYQTATARAALGAGLERGEASAESPLILDFDRGIQAAERILREAATSGETLSATLPPSAADIRPGMLLPLTLAGRDWLFLIERITDAAARTIEARAFDPSAFGGITAPQGQSRGLPVFGSDSVLLLPLDLPILRDRPEVAEWDGFFAAHASSWPSAVGVIQATTPTGDGDVLVIDPPATIGETLTDLDPGRPWTWDAAASVEIRLYRGVLTTRTREDVQAGNNVIALEHAGGWEILQFAEADLIGPNTWRLTDLVRGARGTEFLSASSLPTGARVVVLDGALSAAGLSSDQVGLAYHWRYGPAANDTTTYPSLQHAFEGVGRRPWAPARLTAADQSGDTVLAWSRRARIGDGWTLSTSPALDEAAEEYRVEIGPVGAPIRAATATAPTWTYSALMKAADGVTGPVEIRVAQVSATWGAGTPATLTVTL